MKLKSAFQCIPSSTALLAVDYVTEIQNAVGIEIYTPIFKAGLFLFVSGILSAAITALIINSADTWSELAEEIQLGKESQLIPREGDRTRNIARQEDLHVNVSNFVEISAQTSTQSKIVDDDLVNLDI